jgi:hypothetical protein
MRRIVHKPFFLRVSIGTQAVRSEVVDVFFEEEEGFFSES